MVVGVVVLQPGGDQRLADVDCVARLARRAAAALHGEHLAAQRVEDDAGEQRTAGLANGDRHPPRRHSTGVVRRAVERIDDPRVRSVRVSRRALLAEDGVVGVAAEQELDDRRLRGFVCPRDDIGARRFLDDLGRPQQTVHQSLSTRPGCVDGGFKQVRVAHSGEPSCRWRATPMPRFTHAQGAVRHQRVHRRSGTARRVSSRRQAMRLRATKGIALLVDGRE